MADYGFIANQPQTSPMTAINGILDVARGAQALQTSRQQYESQNIDLQKQRQANQERVATQSFMQDPKNWQDDSGNIDMGKINAAVTKFAPMTGAETIGKLSTLSEAQTSANKAKLGFDTDMRQILGQTYGILGRAGVTDPKIVSAELDSLKAQYPNNKNVQQYVDSAKVGLQNMEAGPHVKDTLIRQAQQFLSPAQQQSLAPTAGFIQTGGEQLPTVSTPSVGAAAPTIEVGKSGTGVANTLPPGAVETTEIGPDKNSYIVTRGANGTILGTRPLAGQNGGTGGTGNMPRFAPGDQDAIPVLEGERTSARNMLSSAPIAHTTNRGILEEIDKVSTGTIGPTLQKLFSTLGIATDTAEQRASSYDLVGKYLERNAIEAAKSMGPHTNAGLESAIKANGSVTYNPTAIKKLTRLNDAIVSGAEMYQPGLEKAIAADPQRGVLAKREFDQAWAQNFDPRIMEIQSASKSGDTKTIAEIRKQLGPDGIKELVRKADALERLSQSGK